MPVLYFRNYYPISTVDTLPPKLEDDIPDCTFLTVLYAWFERGTVAFRCSIVHAFMMMAHDGGCGSSWEMWLLSGNVVHDGGCGG
jgi:hypothetical protein